jgi:hypothetical protein
VTALGMVIAPAGSRKRSMPTSKRFVEGSGEGDGDGYDFSDVEDVLL